MTDATQYRCPPFRAWISARCCSINRCPDCPGVYALAGIETPLPKVNVERVLRHRVSGGVSRTMAHASQVMRESPKMRKRIRPKSLRREDAEAAIGARIEEVSK